MANERLPFGRILGLRTTERPRGVGAPTLPPPTREPPPPISPAYKEAVEELFDTLAPSPTKDEVEAANSGAYAGSTRTAERIGGRLAKGAIGLVLAGGGIYAAYETIPAVHERVDSFLNSFTDNSLVARAETKKVNPSQVFDSNATEEVISDNNTIEMILEEYQKIAPPTIDRKTPAKINIGLSIENADGSNNIGRVIIKKRPDYIGGGERTTNFKIDPQTGERRYDGQVLVNSNFIFEEGLEGKKVGLIIKDAKKVTIENKSTEDTRNLKRGGFHLHIESSNGDTAVFIIGTTGIELTQYLPPSRTEKLGNSEWRLVSTPVPIESNEGIAIVPLGRITTSSKQNFNSGVLSQMSVISVSTVTDENGIKQVGPAEIMFNTTDGKLIVPKAKQ